MEILLPCPRAACEEDYFFKPIQNIVEYVMSKSRDNEQRKNCVNNKSLSAAPTSSLSPSPKRSLVIRPTDLEWSRLNFPHRLHHMLTFMEEEGLSHIAHWDEHGECFTVKNSEKLVNTFFPLFFQHRKWKSFQRVRACVVVDRPGSRTMFDRLSVEIVVFMISERANYCFPYLPKHSK